MEKGEITHVEQFHLFLLCFPKVFFFNALKWVCMKTQSTLWSSNNTQIIVISKIFFLHRIFQQIVKSRPKISLHVLCTLILICTGSCGINSCEMRLKGSVDKWILWIYSYRNRENQHCLSLGLFWSIYFTFLRAVLSVPLTDRHVQTDLKLGCLNIWRN